ncbi:MAG: hypothetical protein KAH25_13180, partial [Bacteroidales bacterium]|nr:hypothetical protein [Bacteroidales bacterium]
MNKYTFFLIFTLTIALQTITSAQNRHIRAGDEYFEEQLYQQAAEKYKKGYKKLKDNEIRKEVSFKLAESYRLTNELRRA